jgi:hypothetical protein
LAQATKPEKLDKIYATIMANPIRDRRKKADGPTPVRQASHAPAHDTPFDDSIPF